MQLPRVAVWAVPALALFFLGRSPACQTGEQKVKVCVVAILASEKEGEIDPRLKSIAEEVRKREPQLKSFELALMSCKSLPVGAKPAAFKLVEEQEAQVVVQHGSDQDDRVGLTVKAPLQGGITYRTVCGKFLPIVTRYKTAEKKRLILAVMVKPCKSK